MSLRVVLVDDQALVCAGFRMILKAEPGLEVVGEAGNGREAVEVVAATAPDVVLMDVRMPERDGIEATRRVTSATAAPRVLMLTAFDLDELVDDACAPGPAGSC